MNVKFLNPFVEAAHQVLLAEAGVNMTRGELSLEKNSFLTDDVTVILGLVGQVQGTVSYSMGQATALNLASLMLGETLTAFEGLAQSGVAELGNVITGRASVKLSEAGYEATISPPTLLYGRGATITTLDLARLVVPLEGACGPVVIRLALREMASTGLSAAMLATPAAPSLSR